MKQSYSDKAIKLAIKHGYTGGWHQPDSEVFKDENFWRAVAKGLEINSDGWKKITVKKIDKIIEEFDARAHMMPILDSLSLTFFCGDCNDVHIDEERVKNFLRTTLEDWDNKVVKE